MAQANLAVEQRQHKTLGASFSQTIACPISGNHRTPTSSVGTIHEETVDTRIASRRTSETVDTKKVSVSDIPTVNNACCALGKPSIRHTGKRFEVESHFVAELILKPRLSCTLQAEAEPGKARAGELL